MAKGSAGPSKPAAAEKRIHDEGTFDQATLTFDELSDHFKLTPNAARALWETLPLAEGDTTTVRSPLPTAGVPRLTRAELARMPTEKFMIDITRNPRTGKLEEVAEYSLMRSLSHNHSLVENARRLPPSLQTRPPGKYDDDDDEDDDDVGNLKDKDMLMPSYLFCGGGRGGVDSGSRIQEGQICSETPWSVTGGTNMMTSFGTLSTPSNRGPWRGLRSLAETIPATTTSHFGS